MSGHSHYATIKRQKESKDAAKGKAFSKMARAIQIAVKTGGSPDPNANYKLRMAVDAARSVNMPKENIDRAINKASAEAANIDEVVYEGFGPGGIAVIVQAATDNKNRTGQEIKNLFERGGGNMAGPGSVSYNFEQKGLIVVKKTADVEEMILKLIDAGAEDVEESGEEVEIYTTPSTTSEVKNKIENLGYSVEKVQLIMKAKSVCEVSGEVAEKAIDFLDRFEEHDDVQEVYTNLEMTD